MSRWLALLVLLLESTFAWGAASDVRFATDPPGIGLEAGDQLLVALPIRNVGTADAEKISVTSATLGLQGASAPSPFPVALDPIPAGEDRLFNIRFKFDPGAVGKPQLLTVRGTYQAGGTTHGFAVNRYLTLPRPGPGSELVQSTSVAPLRTTGDTQPVKPIVFPPEVNPEGPPVPNGPARFLGFSASGSTLPQSPNTEGGTSPQLQAGNMARLGVQAVVDPVVFAKDTRFGNLNQRLIPPDPSGASGGNVVLATNNTFLAYSVNAGDTFTKINPTTIFSDSPDGGLCCDQSVQYVPSINRFVWLIQTWRASPPVDALGNATGPNRLRIAVASPDQIAISGARAWTYWDLTSAVFGFGNDWMDFPDMSVGTNFLYVSVDRVSGGAGLLVVRIPLQQLQSGSTINIDFTTPSDSASAYFSHITQDTGDEVFWAGHLSNSRLRIFSLKEGDGRYFWRDVNISDWPNSDYTSNAPDGRNWLSFGPGAAILGATRRNAGGIFGCCDKELWFAWTAGRGAYANNAFTFPQPHIQIAHINGADFSVIGQMQVWNADFAFAYAGLATNSNLEVGLSLAWGGGSRFYNTHAVGIWGDFEVWNTIGSNLTATYNVQTSAGPPPVFQTVARWGDYTAARQHAPDARLFSAFGYAVLQDATDPSGCSVSVGCSFDGNFVLFGRQSVVFPPPPPR